MAITVDNDPDAIQQYRGRIEDSIGQLQAQLKKTEIAIERVGESWKDDNFMAFYTNFNNDKSQIEPLCKILDDYANNILYQLEMKLRTYIGGPTRI